MIIEKPCFFRQGDRPLFGMLYSPQNGGVAGSNRQAGRGIVVCDSFYEEKFWCERVFSNLGRFLAEKGYQVLVFDYFGYGSSAGDSIDLDLNSLGQDIHDACSLLRGQGVNRISLLGVRYGGALACQAAAACSEVDSVFLVNPVKKWKTEFMKMLRANVAGQYSIFKKAVMTRDQIIEDLLAGGDCTYSGYHMNNVDGFCFSRDFYLQLQDTSLPVELPERIKSLTIFTIPEKKTASPPKIDKLVAEFQALQVNSEGLVITDDNPFWLNYKDFTSEAPVFYQELYQRLEALPADPPQASAAQEAVLEPLASVILEGVQETAVNFPAEDGSLHFGVLYQPSDCEAKGIAFLFSHCGLIGFNGDFRIHTRAARRFAKDGFPCLCFDPLGMGRAKGKIGNKVKLELYYDINVGILSDDVDTAIAFFKDNVGEKKIVSFGVCGGAITNLFAHGRTGQIDTSITLSAPVMLPDIALKGYQINEEYSRFYLSMYAPKFFSPKAWWRVITFKSEYGNVFKLLRTIKISALGALKRLFKRLKHGSAPAATGTRSKPAAPPSTAASTAAASSQDSAQDSAVKLRDKLGANPQTFWGEGAKFNDLFLEAYRNIIKGGGRIIFVFGEHDNFKWEYNNEFAAKYPEEIEWGKDSITVKEIQHANHMYTLPEWQEEIFDYCLEWANNE